MTLYPLLRYLLSLPILCFLTSVQSFAVNCANLFGVKWHNRNLFGCRHYDTVKQLTGIWVLENADFVGVFFVCLFLSL